MLTKILGWQSRHGTCGLCQPAAHRADVRSGRLATELLPGCCSIDHMAVAEGFEPPDGFSRLSLSRRVH